MSRYCTDYQKNKAIFHLWSGQPKKIVPKTDACLELSLVFGFDHMLGLFAEVWEKKDETEHVASDRSSQFDGLSRSHMIELIEYYSTEEERETKFKDILILITLDLPF